MVDGRPRLEDKQRGEEEQGEQASGFHRDPLSIWFEDCSFTKATVGRKIDTVPRITNRPTSETAAQQSRALLYRGLKIVRRPMRPSVERLIQYRPRKRAADQ